MEVAFLAVIIEYFLNQGKNSQFKSDGNGVFSCAFVFDEVQSVAIGKHQILSIMVGVSYFLLDKIFASIVQFFHFPIFFGAIGPALFFMFLALWWMWQQRWRLV